MDEIQVTDPRLTFAAMETIQNVQTRVNHAGGKTPPGDRNFGLRAAEAIRLDSTTVGSI